MNTSTSKSDLSREERRSGKRGRTFKSAKLVFGGFSPTVIDCLVIEMSDVGARVETSAMTQTIEILTLRLSDGTEHRARRAWAMGNEMGLEFLP
jgi:hypothetical protein